MATSACSTTNAAPSRDAAHAFCLFSDEQPHLADTAVALGLAGRGTATQPIRVVHHDHTVEDLTIDQWSATHQLEFDRACQAVVGATQLPHASSATTTPAATSVALLPVLAGLLPVFAGALITAFAAGGRESTARSRLLADALRAATREFVRTSKTYVRQWTDSTQGGRPADQDLRESRDELAAKLHEVAGARPSWSVPHQLLRQLAEGPLSEQLARQWADSDDQTRSAEEPSVHAQLSELDITIHQVARALEQPGRPHRAMRRSDPTSRRRQTAA